MTSPPHSQSPAHVSLVDSISSQIKLLWASDPTSMLLESDPVFVSARKLLITLAPVSSVALYVFTTLCGILEETPADARAQANVVLQLLAQYCEAKWRLKESGTLVHLEDDAPYTVMPDPLESHVAHVVLRSLVPWMLRCQAKRVHKEILGGPATFELRYADQLAADIDGHIRSVATYVGAACPIGFLAFVEKGAASLDPLPSLELLAYLCLSPQLLDRELGLATAQESSKALIHAYFLCNAVLSFAAARPRDFLDAALRPSTQKLSDALFEKLYQRLKFAQEYEKKYIYRALALALILLPRQIEYFIAPEAARARLLKGSSNRKQKLLQHAARALLEGPDRTPSLELFLVLFLAALAALSVDPKHPLVVAAKSHVHMVYNVLAPNNNRTLAQDTELAAIDRVRVKFYLEALILAPELIKPKVITIIANPDTLLQFYYIIAHAILGLLKKPYHRDSAHHLVGTVAITLRDHCMKLAEIIRVTADLYEDSKSASNKSLSNKSATRSFTPSPAPLSRAVLLLTLSEPERLLRRGLRVVPFARDKYKNHDRKSSAETVSLLSTQLSALGHGVSTANAEYLHKVENKAFLAREILKLVFQIFRVHLSFFFKLPSIYAQEDGIDLESLRSHSGVNAEAMRVTRTVLPEFPRILLPILVSLADPDQKLVEGARRLILKLLDAADGSYQEQYIAFFSSCYLQLGFIDIVLSLRLANRRFLELVSFMSLFWTRRALLVLRIDCDALISAVGPDASKMVQQCISDCEKLLIVLIAAPGTKFYRVLRRNCALFASEMEGCKYKVNWLLFKAIADDTYVVSSSVALQKRLRGMVRDHIERYSEGVLAAIDIAYERWNDGEGSDGEGTTLGGLSSSLKGLEEMSQNVSLEHRNYAGLLAVLLGGIACPKYKLEDKEKNAQLEAFVASVSGLLQQENAKSREAAKELLARDLHPFALGYVISSIKRAMQALLARKESHQIKANELIAMGRTPPREYLTDLDLKLMDLHLGIVFGLLESPIEALLSHITDLRIMCQQVVAILQPVAVGENARTPLQEDSRITRLKIRSCRLFLRLLEVVAGGACPWRSSLAASTLQWLDFVCFGGEKFDLFVTGIDKADVFLYFDLALECLNTVSSLFNETRIYAHGAQYLSEIDTIRSQMFSSYFTLFLRILDRCLAPKKESSREAAALARKTAKVKDAVIIALSKMLEYNYDVGLSMAMPLAFHSDLQVKHLFMIVFRNIIGTIQHSRETQTPEFQTLSFIDFAEHITRNPDLVAGIAKGIQISDHDDFARSMLEALQATGRAVPQLLALIEREVAESGKPTDLLRKTSVQGKMLLLYSKSLGGDYLRRVLTPVFENMEQTGGFEVEKAEKASASQTEIEPEHYVKRQVSLLMKYLHLLVSSICDSVDLLPLPLKILCARIRTMVREKSKSDSTALLVLSLFVFLRFLCPAIVNPELEGIVAPDKRLQIQLAKVFQSLANDAPVRWPALRNDKTELIGLKNELFRFLDVILSPTYAEIEPPASTPRLITKSTFLTLYLLLMERSMEISKVLAPYMSTVFEEVHVLERVSSEIGANYLRVTPSMPEYIRKNREQLPEIYDLFVKYQDADVSEMIQHPIMKLGYTRDGVLLLTMLHHNFQRFKNHNFGAILFRALQVAYRRLLEPFQLLIDCLFFEKAHSYVIIEFMKALGGFGTTMYRDAVLILYYNVNDDFFGYFLESILPLLLKFSNEKRLPSINFYLPFDPIEKLEAIGAPQDALERLKDTIATYGCLIYLEAERKYAPAVLKISPGYVFWSHVVRKFEVGGQLRNVRVTNTSAAVDWYDAEDAPFVTFDGNEFKVLVKGHGVVRLSSLKKDDIMKTIFLAKKMVPEPKMLSMRLADQFLGTMMALVLLNMLSSLEAVRSILFESLANLVGLYKLSPGREIAVGASFPADHVPYVLDIARAFAKNHLDLTKEFVRALCDAYHSAESKYNCIILLGAWASNVKDDHLLKKCVQLIPEDRDLLVTYKTHVWKRLASPEACAAVVNEAVTRDISGQNWDSLVAVIASASCKEIQKFVVTELSQVADIPNFTTDKQMLVAVAWIRCRVLMRALETLTFSLPELAEFYFPEVCFCLLMLVSIGPTDLREAVRRTSVHVMGLFLQIPISGVLRSHVQKIIADFSGANLSVVFGLLQLEKEQFAVFLRRADQFYAVYQHLESFCSAFLRFIELQSPERKKIWLSRWREYAMKAAFHTHGPLQARGVLVSGVIGKALTDDKAIASFLHGYCEWCSGYLQPGDFVTCVAFLITFLNFVEVLRKDSKLWTFSFWTAYIHTLSDNAILLHAALRTLRNTVASAVREGLLTSEIGLEQLFDISGTSYCKFVQTAEDRARILTQGGFANQVFGYICLRALTLPYVKALGWDSLVLFFKVAISYDKAHIQGSYFSSASYLALIYIIGSLEESCEELMVLCGLEPQHEEGIPLLVIDFFTAQTDQAVITMYQLANYFRYSGADAFLRLRFLKMLNYLKNRAPNLVFYAYELIGDTLASEIEITGLLEMLDEIFTLVEFGQTYTGSLDHFRHVFVGREGLKRVILGDHDPLSEDNLGAIVNLPIRYMLLDFYQEEEKRLNS